MKFFSFNIKISQQHYNWRLKSAKTMIFYYGLDELSLMAMVHVS